MMSDLETDKVMRVHHDDDAKTDVMTL